MTMKETITENVKVRLMNSFGETEWEEVEMTLHVRMNDSRTYGSFETYQTNGSERYYAEGGLWITDNELVDYDGVFSIDTRVLDVLDSWNFDTSDMRSSLK